MSLMVGRISYFPDDVKLREIRSKTEQRARKDLINILPKDIKIIKIAQNYHKEEINDDEDVHVYDKLGVSKARNIILEQFYNSDFDYLLINDDDNAFYPYYNIDLFFKKLTEDSFCKKLVERKVHCIRPIEPQYEPFKKENEKLYCDERFVFKQCSLSNLTGAYIFINFKKYFHQEFYFDENIVVNKDDNAECEILDNLIVLMRSGYNCLVLRNLILKNTTTSTGRSTIFEGSEDINKSFYNMVNNTCKKYNIPIINGRRLYSKALPFYKGTLSLDLNGDWIFGKNNLLFP